MERCLKEKAANLDNLALLRLVGEFSLLVHLSLEGAYVHLVYERKILSGLSHWIALSSTSRINLEPTSIIFCEVVAIYGVVRPIFASDK